MNPVELYAHLLIFTFDAECMTGMNAKFFNLLSGMQRIFSLPNFE